MWNKKDVNDEVNLEQAGKTETLCRTGNRNMSTIVRKTASRRGEGYLEMSAGVGGS
jgi:hypothetical protein